MKAKDIRADRTYRNIHGDQRHVTWVQQMPSSQRLGRVWYTKVLKKTSCFKPLPTTKKVCDLTEFACWALMEVTS